MTSEANVQNHTPFDCSEYREREAWRKKVTDKDLNIIPCVSAWFDICELPRLSWRPVGLSQASTVEV